MDKLDRSTWDESSILEDDDYSLPTSTTSSLSGSTCSINLEEGTSIRTTGFSKGFLELLEKGNYLDSDEVPCVPVDGIDIKGKSGLNSFEAKQLQTYRVIRVLSPFEFYLERESDTKDEERKMKDDKIMQDYYEQNESRIFQFSIKVSKMKCYAYYDPLTRHWWRVRVLDYQLEEGRNRAYIYFCDTGKQEHIMCENLRQLETCFQGPCDNIIYKCYLYDVLPVTDDMHWPLDATVFFKELLSDMRLGAAVMKFSKHPVVEHSPDLTIDCGVVLVEKMNLVESPDTINWLLVKMGYARSIGITSTSPTVLDIPGMVPSCATLESSDISKANKTEVSDEELQFITSKAISDTTRDAGVPVYAERPASVKNWKHYLPSSIRSRLAWMKMAFVEGPGRIFIHMYNKRLEFKTMEAEMQQICTTLPQPSIASLNAGSLVTCNMKDPNYPEEDGWCRAIVLNVEKEAVKVLMVDYGNRMWVHVTLLYQFPDQYRYIPSFAHRVHLSDVKPNYDVPQWHSSINNVFLKYTLSHEIDMPLYYLHVPDENNAVYLTDLDQCLLFNDLENKWVAEPPIPTSEDKNFLINSMRNEPMLASHFISKAVSIFYELAVDEITFWDFAKLSEFLVHKEYATDVMPNQDKNKIHEIVRNGFGIL